MAGIPVCAPSGEESIVDRWVGDIVCSSSSIFILMDTIIPVCR